MDGRPEHDPPRAGASPPAPRGQERYLNDEAYARLRAMAEGFLVRHFGKASAGLTLQPTVLVNETLLRLLRSRDAYPDDREFFAIATTAMRNVIVDYVRERRARKRGGGMRRVEFSSQIHSPFADTDNGLDFEALFRGIDRLGVLHARKADVAQMRLVWGAQLDEIANALGVSRATVERDWSFASAWLSRELDGR